MKGVKRVLLGSAAGVIAVTSAQAADLPVKAKPVQYVRICTLYGEGFYYIPGSDTCIRFSGYIRADYGYNVTSGNAANHYSGVSGAQDRTVNSYSTRHRGSFSIDTRTQTAYGTLRTFQTHHMSNENGNEATIVARAFIQWGGFTFGRTVSFTDHEGSVGDAGFRSVYATQTDSTTGANGTNQIAYTWQLGNGITLNVGADERRVKSIANLSGPALTQGVDPASFRAGNNHPNPWVALRVTQAWGRASVAMVANHNQASYYNNDLSGGACSGGNTGTTLCGYPDDKWGWAVISGAEFKLDFLSPGSRIGGYFNYGVGAVAYGASLLASPGLYGSGNQIAIGAVTDASFINGSSMQLTTSWSAGGGFEYFWTRNFSSTVYGTYAEISYNSTVVDNRWFCMGASPFNGATCDPSFTFWTIGTHHDWFPLPGLRFVVDVLHTRVESAMEGQTVALGSKVGARPSGLYTVKDLGITSVVFRAIRAWGG